MWMGVGVMRDETPNRRDLNDSYKYTFVSYETIKRKINKRLINECRCDERLKSTVEGSTRLTYTGLRQDWHTGGKKGGNYLRWRSLPFFSPSIFCASKMRVCLGTATSGQKGQTRGPASARDADVREEAKKSARCFITDLW
jgi:hypothetical protein